jgi:hypothetical protein
VANQIKREKRAATIDIRRRGLFEKELESIRAGNHTVRVVVHCEIAERLQSVRIENVKTAIAPGCDNDFT